MEANVLPLVCPWCSKPVDHETERCSACGASLVERENAAGGERHEAAIPGITAVDPALIAQAAKAAAARKSARGIRGILAATPERRMDPIEDVPLTLAEREALKPPTAEVRLEMMRIEAEVLQRIAETEAALRAAEAIAGSAADERPLPAGEQPLPGEEPLPADEQPLPAHEQGAGEPPQ